MSLDYLANSFTIKPHFLRFEKQIYVVVCVVAVAIGIAATDHEIFAHGRGSDDRQSVTTVIVVCVVVGVRVMRIVDDICVVRIVGDICVVRIVSNVCVV